MNTARNSTQRRGGKYGPRPNGTQKNNVMSRERIQREMEGGASSDPNNYKQRFGITHDFAEEFKTDIQTKFAGNVNLNEVISIIDNLKADPFKSYYGSDYLITGNGSKTIKMNYIEKFVKIILTNYLNVNSSSINVNIEYLNYFIPGVGPVINPTNIKPNEDIDIKNAFFTKDTYDKFFKSYITQPNAKDDNGYPIVDENGNPVKVSKPTPPAKIPATKFTPLGPSPGLPLPASSGFSPPAGPPLPASSGSPAVNSASTAAATVVPLHEINNIPLMDVFGNVLTVNSKKYSLFGIGLLDNKSNNQVEFNTDDMFLYANDGAHLFLDTKKMNTGPLPPITNMVYPTNVGYLHRIMGEIEHHVKISLKDANELQSKSNEEKKLITKATEDKIGNLLSDPGIKGFDDLATKIDAKIIDETNNHIDVTNMGMFIREYIRKYNQLNMAINYNSLTYSPAKYRDAIKNSNTVDLTITETKIEVDDDEKIFKHNFNQDVEKFLDAFDPTNKKHSSAMDLLANNNKIDKNIYEFLIFLAKIRHACYEAYDKVNTSLPPKSTKDFITGFVNGTNDYVKSLYDSLNDLFGGN